MANTQIRMEVRQAQESDIPSILRLMTRCYPWTDPTNEARLRAQMSVFPAGQLVVVYDGEVAGLASTMRVDLEAYEEDHRWSTVTGNGFLTTHQADGPDLYGVDVMVDPILRRMKIGERLYQVRKELAVAQGARRIVFGGRMPGLHKHPELDAASYLAKVAEHKIRDQVVSFQLRQGFTPLEVVMDYLPWDKESRGCAALMEWRNVNAITGGVSSRTALPVRVCVIQMSMGQEVPFDTLMERSTQFIAVASSYGGDFVVFPELFTLQTTSSEAGAVGRDPIRTVAGFGDELREKFRELAIKKNINIVAGSTPILTGESVVNRAYLFHRDGRVEHQDKIHITPGEKEEAGFEGSSRISVFQTDKGTIGIPVCYDIEFPELSRILVDAGARILIVPYSTRDRQGHLRVTRCAQARAIENQVFVVTAGTVGLQPGGGSLDLHYAQSGVYTPSDFAFARDGIQAECEPNVEAVLVCDLDLAQLKRNRVNGTVRPYKDRRLDLYKVVYSGNSD